MTLDELIAAYNALSPGDQKRFKQGTKRGPGRPKLSIDTASERFHDITREAAALRGGKEAVFAEQDQRNGQKPGTTKRRYNRALDRLVDDIKPRKPRSRPKTGSGDTK